MRSLTHILTEKDGSVILIVLVVLMAVTALGVTMLNLGSSEQEMSANEQLHEDSFYDADSCVQVTAKFLRHLTDLDDEGIYGIDAGDPIAPGIVYPSSVTKMGFHAKIMRSPDEPYFVDNAGKKEFDFVEDLGFDQNLLAAVADIRPRGETPSPGTAANQQNAGYSAGIGLGGAGSGGFNEWYIVACDGRSVNGGNIQAASRAYGRYKKVPGIPGGL
jgi:hypothetical protein